jgi:hypothetical protein
MLQVKMLVPILTYEDSMNSRNVKERSTILDMKQNIVLVCKKERVSINKSVQITSASRKLSF